MKKLLSAIEYWDEMFECEFLSATGDAVSICDNMNKYISFLKQPLQLWMFIPCDKDGKPLEKPTVFEAWKHPEVDTDIISDLKCKEYKQACDLVLFKGFELLAQSKYETEIMLIKTGVQILFRQDDIMINSTPNYIKTISDLANKVEVTDRIAEQFKY